MSYIITALVAFILGATAYGLYAKKIKTWTLGELEALKAKTIAKLSE